jgi:hypothetical protein
MSKGIWRARRIGQAALVQHRQEGLPGFGKDVRQTASFGNPTGAAIDQPAVSFRMPDHLTDGDFRSRSRQLQSAMAASNGFDEASSPQVLNDLHQVVSVSRPGAVWLCVGQDYPLGAGVVTSVYSPLPSSEACPSAFYGKDTALRTSS